ncbi:hypothetical protein JQ609_31685 [Bradyrhizobium sp. AUGA SZCCT0169]|uniref:hypothetical protein n=1 Tax=Bradyrhizobium sp. AUGA SZCCT0169 TaxID=2807663 RepID=UPI001BA57F3F|nr:hypothetical protein [Bradyrhizobium sp. AUGA SZCCT0169]
MQEGKKLLYRAGQLDCDLCPLKLPKRAITQDPAQHPGACPRRRPIVVRRRERKKIEMRFAHIKRIMKLGRL